MSTWELVGTVLVAALLTWLPGVLILAPHRLPRLLTLALAPAATLFATYLGVVSAGALGVRWSPWWLAGVAIVLGGAGIGLRRWRPAPPHTWPGLTAGQIAFVAVMITVAFAIGARAYLDASQNFYVIPQDYDAVFQANAVRWIADSGDGTPQGLAGVNGYASTSPTYYPSTFHALIALTTLVADTGVVAALHAHILLWMLVLPLGAAALSRAVGCGAAGAGAAALVSTSFTALPYEVIWRFLLPFTGGLVLVPAVLAVLVLATRRRSLADSLVVAAVAVGLVTTHTSMAPTLVVYGLPLLLVAVARAKGERLAILRWALLTGGLLVILLVPTVLGLRSALTDGAPTHDWPAITTVREGIRTGLLFGTGYRDTVQLTLATLVWAGAALVVLRRYRTGIGVLLGMLGSIALYVLAVAVDGDLSLLFTGAWWNDQLRLSALVAMSAPVFVGVLVDAVAWAGSRAADRFGPRLSSAGPREPGPPSGLTTGQPAASSRLPAPVGVAVGVLTAGALAAGYFAWTDQAYFLRNRDAMLYRYGLGPTVTENERAGMERLPEVVTEGARVMNDPRDGSAWMFALSGVRPVFGHMSPDDNSPLQLLLDDRFDQLASDPEVQDAARSLGIGYVWLSEGFLIPDDERALGLDQVHDQPEIFELVYSNPGVEVFRVRWDVIDAG